MKTRREILSWSTPVILSVVLPAHAQCSDLGIYGQWNIQLTSSTGVVEVFILYLSPDEAHDPNIITANFVFCEGDNIGFEVHHPGTDTVYFVETYEKSRMSGSYSNATGVCCPDSIVVRGTWIATRT
jgi:hypothetical protein